MMRLLLAIVICLLPAASLGQTLEQQFSRKVDVAPRERFLTLTLENDSIGAGTDRNYTNGVRIGWFDTGNAPPEAANIVDTLLPVFSVNDTTSVYYSIGHNLYTPRDIVSRTPDPGDRPYAAFLYGSMGLAGFTGNRMDQIELTAGVVGPLAGGEGIQKFVHGITGSDTPSGWNHQLKNEPGLMLSWQRLWPEAYSAKFGSLRVRTMPYGGAAVGNIYTYANTGLVFQLVPERYKWQGLPARVRPAMPGSGYFSVPENRFAWSVFAGLEGRGVAHNIFLDGNSFESGPSVDKKYLVGDANIGLALTYGRAQITYTLNWRSEEFHGQDGADLFGAAGIGYRF